MSSAFLAALLRGMTSAVAVALVSFLMGLPTGLAIALHEFPLRRLLVFSISVGLVLPSFLVAIGLSMLIAGEHLPGWIGTVWSLAPIGLALVAFATYAATSNITGSQIAAARLAGGESVVLQESARAVWPVAALAATFAGILALSDAGPGLVFGHHGAAAEILTSFSAQYDFQQAARQCLILSGVVAVLALPCAAMLAPRLAKGLLARDTSTARAASTNWKGAEAIVALSVVLVVLGLPLTGLLLPLAQDFPLTRALTDTGRTAAYTLIYALSAGAIATVLGFALAIFARQSQRGQALLLTGLLVLLALPPAFTALGWVQLATTTPAGLDWLMRGGPLLALHLGLRLLPVATLFALRAVNSASPSWYAAAELHGVRPASFLRKILIPWAAPALWTSTGAVALLALADITSALLLHPPGRGTIPLTIFSVMANAPEAYVATLCLVYLAGSLCVLALGMRIVRQWL
jgi:ABC-type Fe3+ transport system permease subunit